MCCADISCINIFNLEIIIKCLSPPQTTKQEKLGRHEFVKESLLHIPDLHSIIDFYMRYRKLKEKKVWQSSSYTYNDPTLIVDACDGNTDPQLKLKIQIQNFTIRFANTAPTFPYIVELSPPTLIRIQSLSYETQVFEVNLVYCDVRGREIGVCGAMFHVEQGDVSIYNCTFRGPESVYDLSSTSQYHDILQRTAAVYWGIKCYLIYISNRQYYGLYQRANQVSNDSSLQSFIRETLECDNLPFKNRNTNFVTVCSILRC
ncbi:MAG: hypothetical protein EZS28_002122 [Streblomastix strix]|uniref:Uncharacterized protein n=1 Tax=Streblomastix strix TaxID=222440 RepID=A0A5J4X543_9EUKA|nr:MAG: hypothetical protein EZS28_002122 [Streblomastix strix]